MFMGGKAGAEEVKCLNEVFGKAAITASPVMVPKFELATSAEQVHRINNDEAGVQGAIRVGRLFPNRHHPDYTPMVVLNTLFGGYFGSRLMSNIREDKGYTYGIYSSVTPEVSGGSMVIHTETGTGVIENAVKEIYYEMETLCNEEVSEEELLLVKNYLLGGLLGDLDGPFSILQRWRSLILNGFDENYFNNNVEIYKTITPAAIQALARKYYNRADFIEIVVI
jgi:predicted Zn-dependent peptidase